MVAVDVVVLVAVALLAVLVVGLLRSNAELTRAMHTLGIDLSPDSPAGAATGASTPVRMGPTPPHARPTPARPDPTAIADVAGLTPTGDAIGVGVAGVRHDTLLAFLSSGCATCRVMWDAFREGAPGVPGGARLVAVTRGSEAESPGVLAELAGTAVPVVMSTPAWEDYDVPYAPYFVYVSGAEGRVLGEGAAATWDAVRTLIGNALADAGAPTAAATAATAVGDVDARWRKAAADAEREQRIDRELAAAGILPGDPRMHPTPVRGAGGVAAPAVGGGGVPDGDAGAGTRPR